MNEFIAAYRTFNNLTMKGDVAGPLTRDESALRLALSNMLRRRADYLEAVLNEDLDSRRANSESQGDSKDSPMGNSG